MVGKSDVYSGIFCFINLLENEDIEKIPYDILKKIMEEKNNTYNTKYDSLEEFFEDKAIIKETKILIIYLYLKFLCESPDYLNNIKKEVIKNEKEFKTNVFQYFKHDIEKIDNEQIKEENLIIIEKKSFFTKLINFVKGFWKINK